jgi:hypothetical protein
MIYSVWRWGRYDYYDVPTGEGLGDLPQKQAPRGSGPDASVQPEAILPVLPAGAKPVGSGPKAKGRIAVTGEEAAAATFADPGKESSWLRLGVLAVVAWGVYKLLG